MSTESDRFQQQLTQNLIEFHQIKQNPKGVSRFQKNLIESYQKASKRLQSTQLLKKLKNCILPPQIIRGAPAELARCLKIANLPKQTTLVIFCITHKNGPSWQLDGWHFTSSTFTCFSVHKNVLFLLQKKLLSESCVTH